MQNTSTSNMFGWSISIIIYVCILFGVAYTLESTKNKELKYTAQKKNLINITLVDRKKTTPKKVKKRKIVEKKTTVKKEKKVVEKPKKVKSKTVKSKPDFKKLFSKINVDKIPEKKQKRVEKVRKKIEKKEVVEVKKSDVAKKIIKSLEFEKQENLIVTSKDGIYDEFRGKIADILEANWQATIDTVSGNEATVLISIDKFGNLDYKIESLSYSDVFNAKLRDFLEEMKDTTFPAYKGTGVFKMKTKFKDIME
ncbi:TonB C-terminal domain-containing protein [Sulfurospirillum sp. 1307]|jgi:protein TonB